MEGGDIGVCVTGGNGGDVQRQSSWDEALTFWASEVSLQQQALKNRDNLNWFKATAERNELTNIPTVLLKKESSFTTTFY